MTTLERPPARTAATLRTLYLARSGVAVVWAGLLVAVGSPLGPVASVLLVLYPLIDAAAAALDLRSSRATRVLSVNIALSVLAAAGIAVAVASGVPDVLRVWGVWAIAAGVVQLVVAISRYRLGGQWAMILSGGISTLAGTGFIVSAGGASASLGNLAGYATLGGVFFLVSALRLRRTTEQA